MPTLHVRDCPEETYERIRELASANKRSLSAEAVKLLDEALRNHERRPAHAEALAWILRNRHVYPAGKKVPDSVELLREDRAR